MDFKAALTGISSNNKDETVHQDQDEKLDQTTESVVLDDETSHDENVTDTKTDKVEEEFTPVKGRKSSKRGRGSNRGRGSSRGGSSRGRESSRGRDSGKGFNSGKRSGKGFNSGKGKNSGKRKVSNKVERSEEYWKAFREAVEILFNRTLFNKDDLEQAAVNSRYMVNYRGESKWFKIKSEEDDVMSVLDANGKSHDFSKSRILTSRSFRNKLEDHYSVAVPNMFVKIYQSYKNKDVCIKLCPNTRVY